MKTKGKLTLIVAIIGAILFLAASFLAWNAVATYRLVNSVAPTLETLTLLNEIQSRLHRQQHALTYFLISGEPASQRTAISCRVEIDNKLQRLAILAAKFLTSGTAGERKFVADSRHLQGNYQQYLERLERCLQANRGGDQDESLRILHTEVTPYWEEELLVKLGQMNRAETRRIQEIYHGINLKLGALPWVAGAGLRQLERAVSGVDYALAVSNVELVLYRQVNELTEFLLQAETQDWKEFWGHQIEMRRQLEEWRQVILHQQAMGVANEDEDEKRFAVIAGQYENILPELEKAVAVRVSLGRPAGLEYVERNVMASLDDHLFPTLDDIAGDSRAEVKGLHEGLLKTVLVGSAAGLSVIVGFSLLILLLARRMTNNIVSSLTRLKNGTEIIKDGDLEYRIRIPSSDEFSELAASFNAMTGALKEHNDELKAFVFSVAHDLRAPLVNLKGFSSELRRDLDEVMPRLLVGLAALDEGERERVTRVLEQSVPEALGYIDASANKLDSLVQAVLHLSRIGFRELNAEEIDVEALVHAAMQNFAHLLREKNITVTVGPLPPVVADRLVMEQCLANLLDNAFKYLEAGRPGAISITAEKTKKEVIFYIQDNGRGIAPEDLQKVFEIFRRAGQQDRPGEGMGLAFVKALARRQGGNVWCESTPGEGSTFCFSVPAAGERRLRES